MAMAEMAEGWGDSTYTVGGMLNQRKSVLGFCVALMRHAKVRCSVRFQCTRCLGVERRYERNHHIRRHKQ